MVSDFYVLHVMYFSINLYGICTCVNVDADVDERSGSAGF